MSIQNALAGVAVHDLDAAVGWYNRVFGAPGRRAMPDVAEWRFARGGSLHVFQDKERAGKSSVTLVVTDLDEHVADMQSHGVAVERPAGSAMVKIAIVRDPDGNQLVFAQPLPDELAY